MSPALKFALGIPSEAPADSLYYSRARLEHLFYSGRVGFNATLYYEFLEVMTR